MSREKMLQAEIALKDEQLADLTKEVERLRRQAEESVDRAQATDALRSQNAELKRAVSQLAPAAKKTGQYAAELNEARRRMAAVEKERNELEKKHAATRDQAATLKSAVTKRRAMPEVLILREKKRRGGRKKLKRRRNGRRGKN